MTTRVTVYCGSRVAVPASYLELAAEVGASIAARGWSLTWGGSSVSMMGEVARAARGGGARTLGVIPKGLVGTELADDHADELVVVDTMRERKALMEAHGDAFLALPGERKLEVMRNVDAVAMARQDLGYGKFKWLVLVGYYQSEAGATQELRYELVPGAWRACLPLAEVGRASAV